uniref:BMA-CRN-7 n=1 Tax=Brugia malayi TaxID=6279 RepID=A0A0J9XM30_BRUMA|nr:BMA-CRN-7 [Brugia malayi]
MIFKMIRLLMIVAMNDIIMAQFSCKNRNGKSVDWFVFVPLKELSFALSSKESFQVSLGRLEIISKNCLSTEPLEKFNFITVIIQQYELILLYQYYNYHLQELFYLFYNDQAPVNEKKSHLNRAHAKGVAVFGNTSGFWLVHSVPKFPSLKRYSYAENGQTYGQSFLCVTLKTTSIKNLANAMRYIYPEVYGITVPRNFLNRFPLLEDLKELKKKRISNMSSLLQNFKSNGNVDFFAFSKTGKYNKDLYLDLIAKEMNVSLFAETWMNGAAKDLNSECTTKYKVINVKELNVAGDKFASNRDHSKWAIAENKTKPLVCIGDINRQESQKKRGGGAVCLLNKNIWNLYNKSITDVEIESIPITLFILHFASFYLSICEWKTNGTVKKLT